jgi:toxin FitB
MKILLDTNVVSELVAKAPSSQVMAWIDSLDPIDLYLSVISIGEIQRGIQRLPESHRRLRLLSWLHDDLLLRFDGRVLAIDTDVMLAWGKLVASQELKGRALPFADSLIAAQAIHFRCALATRNEADFEGCGIVVINPWNV